MSTDIDIEIDEKIKKEIDYPQNYKVVFLNDEVTPMEWVIELLTTTFKHSRAAAENITLTIHSEGSGIAGVYKYEVAEQKSLEAAGASRERGFPLGIRIDEE
jgi:ATP-dependent Clp protease adaptor protein ClpS